jgi:hypothetical protein
MVNNAFFYRSQAGADLLNAVQAANRPAALISAEHPAAAKLAKKALAAPPFVPHAIAVLNWKSGIMVVGNNMDSGRTTLERWAAGPLAKWLEPSRRAHWMARCNAVLDVLALPGAVTDGGE